MDWEPQQQDLGALGFAGICREIYRVSFRAILPSFSIILTAPLLAHIAAFRAILSRLGGGDDDDAVRRVACWAAFIAFEIVCMCVLQALSSLCTVAYIYRVASLYCTDGDSATDAPEAQILDDIPHASSARFLRIVMHVFPLAMSYIFLSGLALLLLLHLDDSHEVVVLPLKVLGGTACLLSAAYVAVVSHIACVVAMLEDVSLLGAVHKSRALLDGKLWAAAAVFVPLDGCFVALQVLFSVVMREDLLGLRALFQLLPGAATAVALWAVVALTLLAQPVIYLVCKNHHHEVVDKVHLNYVGEYQQLAVDGDNGVELQPVNTAPQPTATAAQAPGQSPAGGTP